MNADSPAPTRLNLGCGQFPLAGYLNVDSDPRAPADRHLDLDALPYPLPAGQFTEIALLHTLEHLEDPFAVMAELHRLLAPAGVLDIAVPHFSRGFTHADHKRGFDVTFPYYFDPHFPGGYTGIPFRCERVRLRWLAQPYLKQRILGRGTFAALRGLDAVFTPLANLSPAVCSRLWCFWVGGFEEVRFRLRKA
jgi:SAM-dependent methyltransferase